MKKYFTVTTLLIAFCITVFSQSTNAETISAGISKYKKKNYVGCVQDMKAIIKKDPTNAMAYYYLGLANVQLGLNDEAKDAYSKVETLSTNAKLKEYASMGIACIDEPDKCKTSLTEEEELLKSKKFASPKATKTLKELEAERELKNINRTVEQYKSEATTTDKVATATNATRPTKDEIAQALDTLARAGINPYANSQMQADNDLMQLNMMFGNNNNNQNNSYFNMLPYIQRQQANGQKIKPEVMQAMMMQSMMGNMNYGY